MRKFQRRPPPLQQLPSVARLPSMLPPVAAPSDGEGEAEGEAAVNGHGNRNPASPSEVEFSNLGKPTPTHSQEEGATSGGHSRGSTVKRRDSVKRWLRRIPLRFSPRFLFCLAWVLFCIFIVAVIWTTQSEVNCVLDFSHALIFAG